MKTSSFVSFALALGLLATLATPAHAVDWGKRWKASFRTYEAGHLKMWWTTNGTRDPHPFINSDIVPPAGGYTERGWLAPRDNINDVHEEWTLAKNNKTSNTNVVTDAGYAHPSFADYLDAYPFDEVTYFGLADELEFSDVEVFIDLTLWGDHLMVQPLPDPNAVYLFTAGLCPELPGHEAHNASTPGPFTGPMTVVSQTTLAKLIPGDLDGDGFVGITDLNIVLSNWNQNVPPANPAADPSGDSFIGIEDLNIVLGNWNAGTPPSDAANIPEPGALVVLGLGIPVLIRRKK